MKTWGFSIAVIVALFSVGCASVDESAMSRATATGEDFTDAAALDAGLDSDQRMFYFDAQVSPLADARANQPTDDAGSMCQPRTCADLGAQCGRVADGCGEQMQCGSCGAPASCQNNSCVAPFDDTQRKQLNYVVVPHPDDEIGGWALIENSPANYNVFIHLTRGEGTGYCNAAFSGYDHASEALPGNRSDYKTQSCATLRMGSTLGFYDAMSKVDRYLGPVGNQEHALVGKTLSPGTPGQGCSVSSKSFSIRPGKDSAIVFFDLGDGNLDRCEVEWAVSQVRSLRDTDWLPALPEWSLVGASFYNSGYDNCVVYTHPDHRAVHEALWNTDFGVPGPQYGRTCRSDPDKGRVDLVDQYESLLGVSGDRRVGAAQVFYGWLRGGLWPTGEHDHAAAWSQNQAFWIRH